MYHILPRSFRISSNINLVNTAPVRLVKRHTLADAKSEGVMLSADASADKLDGYTTQGTAPPIVHRVTTDTSLFMLISSSIALRVQSISTLRIPERSSRER